MRGVNEMPHQIEPPLVEGEYYPRMARSWKGDQKGSPGWNPVESEKTKIHERTAELANNEAQLHYLKEHLERICQVVYPCEANHRAFGHEIRNVLILACTEVEGQWKGVLKANGIHRDKDRFATTDYAKLLVPMRLDQYSVRFPYYPKVYPSKQNAIWPFRGWDEKNATQSLKWYDAYNNVKHDREEKFKEATLLRAFEAITGFFVIMCAQHGWAFVQPKKEAKTKFFFLEDRPDWPEHYQYKPPANKTAFYKCKQYPFPPRQ
jgi:hypothetical protein